MAMIMTTISTSIAVRSPDVIEKHVIRSGSLGYGAYGQGRAETALMPRVDISREPLPITWRPGLICRAGANKKNGKLARIATLRTKGYTRKDVTLCFNWHARRD